MRIALLGGTGDIGEDSPCAGPTTRTTTWSSARATRTRPARRPTSTRRNCRVARDVKVNGFANEMAADRASIVVLAVPPYHVADTVEAVSDSLAEGDVLVTPAAGIKRDDDGFHYHPPGAGSVTQLVADPTPRGRRRRRRVPQPRGGPPRGPGRRVGHRHPRGRRRLRLEGHGDATRRGDTGTPRPRRGRHRQRRGSRVAHAASHQRRPEQRRHARPGRAVSVGRRSALRRRLSVGDVGLCGGFGPGDGPGYDSSDRGTVAASPYSVFATRAPTTRTSPTQARYSTRNPTISTSGTATRGPSVDPRSPNTL
ncbi:hypothetical protein GJ632_15545 [Halogeometricum sp. CBA1124]|nr:hypothetical protein [Halogeometricum sp. CBA1124]